MREQALLFPVRLSRAIKRGETSEHAGYPGRAGENNWVSRQRSARHNAEPNKPLLPRTQATVIGEPLAALAWCLPHTMACP